MSETNRKIAEKLGIGPRLSWNALTEDESATCMPFESKWEGEQWFADKKKRFPEGSRYDEYHLGAWKVYPDFLSPAVFWPEFEKWLASCGNGVNGRYARYEIFRDGSGSLRIMDFNTDETVGFCDTNLGIGITMPIARLTAWLAALEAGGVK